ncbi:toxin-antitoxin system HicB family antitoxin [Lysobacter sp. F6437]|uniref:toxin-antitoxin system HicB family antitoxin n=1 Tax=Lysobacter sp. F6437 TaxID=3459296 RepID=UPI00403E082E
MINTINIDGHKAVITLDAELGMFRGEFVELNGGADFYAKSYDALLVEGQRSLETFLAICEERGISPKRSFSGKFQVRLPKALHAAAVAAAAARGVSLNQLIAEAVQHETAAA